MRRFRTLLTVIGAVTVLLLAGNSVAYAATGGKFFLGKINKANKQSVLKRTTAGPALKLATKSSTNAPLTVNGRGRVGNLNADLLDGLDSTSLKTSARVFTRDIPNVFTTTNYNQVLPLAAGTYLVAYSAHFVGSSAEGVNCFLRSDPAVGGTSYTAQDSTGDGGAVSGSGLIVQAAGTENSLSCTSETTGISTAASEPVQVVAIKLDTAPVTSLNPVPD